MRSIKTKLRVPYALAVYGKPEIRAVTEILRHPERITEGEAVREFEKRIARIFGKKYGIMVNSGSSANLLAFELLDLPKGSEVITPVLTFGTTLSPILKKGLIPCFADVERGTFVSSAGEIEPLITKRTKAIMIPSLLGNLPDWERLRTIAVKYGLWLIDDSCDTLGAKFAGKPTGYFSDISTTSFYASHVITAAGGGGMLCLDDENIAKRALIMKSWGRESTLFGSHKKSENLRKRFAGMLDGEPYDAKFIFSEIGYNLQPTELQGAFGLAQLQRLPEFLKKRRANFSRLKKFFSAYEKFFILPREDERAETNWLAFPLTIKDGAGFSRYDFTKYLEEHNIQTRPVFTGNVLKQPAFRSIRHRAAKRGYPEADFIMKNGFLIGCHQGLENRHLNYLEEVCVRFLE